MSKAVFTFLVFLVSMNLSAGEASEGDAAAGKDYYALVISGIGGDLKHSEKYQRIAGELRELLKSDYGYAEENIIYLAGDAGKSDLHVKGRSTKANIASEIAELKGRAGPNSQTLVFVVGHANYRNKAAKLHLPGRDIDAEDFGKLFEDFPGKLVLVITTPVSGFFMEPLTGKGRVIVTATKAGMEVSETYFPEAFIDALKEIRNSDEATGDIAELFALARRKTEESFKLRQMVLTEHSMLDDNGDGAGTRELGPESDDGEFARSLFFGPKKTGPVTAAVDKGLLDAGRKWEKLRPAAVVLLHDIEYTVHSDLTYRIKERKQIKILNKRGHVYSDVIIFYNTAYETLSIESARTVKPDGKVHELNPRDILDVKATQSMMYTDSRYKRFSMPSVSEGCIIDYTFVKTGKNLHLSKDFWRTFTVEKKIPQEKFRITFNIPKTRKITYKFTKNELPFKLDKEESEGRYSRTFVFAMEDIYPLTQEPKSPPVQELSTRLIVTSIASWDHVWKWYRELAEGARDSDDEMKKLVGEITKGLDSDVEKARAIYDWVSGSIRYVGLELGKHGYQPHKATSIFSNKFGDCKDKATLLISMLEVAGVEGGSIVLIPTNIMAQVDVSTATLDQFNHVIATIVIDGRRYWLDTTGGETAFGDIPVSDQGRMVFVIGEEKGEFLLVPIEGPSENLLHNRSELELSADGTVTGRDVVTYTGAFATAFRRKYKYESLDAQKRVLEDVLSKFMTAAVLKEYNIEGLNSLADKIVYTREYTAEEYAPVADDLIILNVPLQKIGMLDLVTAGERKNSLVVGQTMMRKGEVALTIPEGYGVRNKPEDIEIRKDFGSYVERYEFDEEAGVIKCENAFTFDRVRITPGEYADFKAFIEEVAKKQRRLVILIRH